ncbi:YhbD family protein [Paenibacillus sp. PAMC21692]|uniref:YhbD family protein n=1 Tax=Paenibacillus sp. PAMC21692 TaxID=2762320 RepID=UPI00164E2E90|nr:YhbD family protein [Paenibacillus sp. PAMC21692]QNK57142.1 YhbD family protein [Paenibacillus sp. PAMC21692]
MERELISKKELLDATGISYGQLYRWKRKGLIPEEWFIRKSVFTGQETFFPKELILARIDKVLNLKDDLSLDELASRLVNGPIDAELGKDDMIERNIVSFISAQRYMNRDEEGTMYSFDRMLKLFTVDMLLRTGEMGLEEGDVLLAALEEHYPKFNGEPCDLVFTRKMGMASFVLVTASSALYFDEGVKMVRRLSMRETAEQLKSKLQ